MIKAQGTKKWRASLKNETANPGTNIKFGEKSNSLTQNKKIMGIEEMVLERAKKEGRTEGEGKKGYKVVKNLILKTPMTNAQIAEIAEVSANFVKKDQVGAKEIISKLSLLFLKVFKV